MAIANSAQRAWMHELGWSDEAISQMGQSLLNSIIADYTRGVKRTPQTALVVDEASGAMSYEQSGSVVTLAEPDDVAIDTFLQGVSSDVVSVAQGVREVAEDIPEAAKSVLAASPLILFGLGALAIYLVFGRG